MSMGGSIQMSVEASFKMCGYDIKNTILFVSNFSGKLTTKKHTATQNRNLLKLIRI